MASSRDVNRRAIFLIADHLDRILANGEDLVRQRFRPHASADGEPIETITTFVRRCHELELSTLAAVIRAREHAAVLAGNNNRFTPLAKLFVSATGAAMNAAELTSAPDDQKFNGCDPIDFMQTRGIIDLECGSMQTIEEIAIDETYLIVGGIQLGALMDMTATFLDAIEVHFDLFPNTSADQPAAPTASVDAETPPIL